MAYIPLDEESKVKGKAAIDVVGARLGKSGGSLIQQFLMLFVPSVTAMSPYIGVIFLIIIGGWIFSVKILGLKYQKLTNDNEHETEREPKAAETLVTNNLSSQPN